MKYLFSQPQRCNRIRSYLHGSPVLELIEALGAWGDPELTHIWAAFEVLNLSRWFYPQHREDYLTLDYLRQLLTRSSAAMPAFRRWMAETQEALGQ